jgi:hypothetical protein
MRVCGMPFLIVAGISVTFFGGKKLKLPSLQVVDDKSAFTRHLDYFREAGFIGLIPQSKPVSFRLANESGLGSLFDILADWMWSAGFWRVLVQCLKRAIDRESACAEEFFEGKL